MFAPLFRFEASDHYMKKKTLTAYPGYAFSACSAPYFINCYETQKALLAHLSREGLCEYCSTISLKLDTKQKWLKRIQICSNEFSRLL